MSRRFAVLNGMIRISGLVLVPATLVFLANELIVRHSGVGASSLEILLSYAQTIFRQIIL